VKDEREIINSGIVVTPLKGLPVAISVTTPEKSPFITCFFPAAKLTIDAQNKITVIKF